MRYFMILLAAGLLAACAPQTMKFQHPDTGEIAQCGPFKTLLEESQCINKYQAKGYERYFDTHTSKGYKIANPGEAMIQKAH